MNYFIGIDQTGAIQKNGMPKPLPTCLIAEDFVYLFYIPSLSRQNLLTAIENYTGVQKQKTKIWACLDCVIGAPKAIRAPWRQLIRLTLNEKGYGREVARQYFDQIGKKKIHRREIELKVGANSVFQTHPFQKNIQTGTFRFWKELAILDQDFYAPAVEKKNSKQGLNSNKISIFEGYPSLSWKKYLKTNFRMPNALPSLLKRSAPKIKWNSELQKQVQKDPNLADAFVLALTIQREKSKLKFLKPNREGHILGAMPC